MLFGNLRTKVLQTYYCIFVQRCEKHRRFNGKNLAE